MKILCQFQCDVAKKLGGDPLHMNTAALVPLAEPESADPNTRVLIRSASGTFEIGHLKLAPDAPFVQGRIYEIVINDVTHPEPG